MYFPTSARKWPFDHRGDHDVLSLAPPIAAGSTSTSEFSTRLEHTHTHTRAKSKNNNVIIDQPKARLSSFRTAPPTGSQRSGTLPGPKEKLFRHAKTLHVYTVLSLPSAGCHRPADAALGSSRKPLRKPSRRSTRRSSRGPCKKSSGM